jgi:hypothetical protein
VEPAAQRWCGAHRAASTAGTDGVEVAKHVGRLLPLETRVEYDPDEIPRAKAARAVDQASRCVDVARRLTLEAH